MTKLVNGVRVEISDEDTAQIKADKAAHEAGAHNRAVFAEIARLEAEITSRRMRDALLTAAGAEWLATQEELIAVERAKLV